VRRAAFAWAGLVRGEVTPPTFRMGFEAGGQRRPLLRRTAMKKRASAYLQ
jgi:hypothetical protein